jgi:hypothetical protein
VKQTKAEVDYTPKAMNPAERCYRCRYFEDAFPKDALRGKCDLVQGDISPNGWCKLFRLGPAL